MLVLTLTAVLAACAETSDVTDREAFISAAVDELESQTWMTEAQARCLVAGQVDVYGYGDLAAAGVSPEQIGNAEIHALSSSMSGAQRAAMIRLVPACEISWAEWFSHGAPTATQRACAAQVAADDELTAAYASSVAGGAARTDDQALVGAYLACFDA